MTGAQSERIALEGQLQIALAIGAMRFDSVGREQRERRGCRMAEVVPHADADECQARAPRRQRRLDEPVRGAVVWHLQHVDLARQPACDQAFLRETFRISGQECVERTSVNEEYHARVVGRDACRLRGRPQSGHSAPADPPCHARSDRPPLLGMQA